MGQQQRVADARALIGALEIIIAHGVGEVSLIKHDDKPFKVDGIFKKRGRWLTG